MYACDFSRRAVEIVQQHPQYAVKGVNAFVADITADPLTTNIAAISVDYCTMVFVLSAVAPGNMSKVSLFGRGLSVSRVSN